MIRISAPVGVVRQCLLAHFADTGLDRESVANVSHQGFVIDTGGFSPTASLSLVLDAALPVLDPHIVLLMAGTNDVNGTNDLAQAPARLVRLLARSMPPSRRRWSWLRS